MLDSDDSPWRAAAAYPFEPQLRLWLLGLSVSTPAALALAGVLPSLLGRLTMLAVFIGVWVLTLRRAAGGLLAAASGARTRREEIEQDVPPGLAGRLVWLWLLGLIPVSAALSDAAGGWLSTGFALAALAVLPLATIVLARSVSFIDALDPLLWRETEAELGRDRSLRLTAALVVFGAGYAGLVALPWPSGLDGLRVLLQTAFWVWATLAWFRLAGLAIRERLPAGAVAGDAPSGDDLTTDALFDRLLRHGGTAAEHRRLSDALLMAGDSRRLAEHGRAHVLALLEGFERPGEAVELAATLLDRVPRFSLADTESMYALIRASEQHGYAELTIRLCGNYLDAFPRSFKNNEVRLVACEAAAGSGGDDRRRTAEWLAELIDASLAADQRTRLKSIVPAYLADGLIQKSNR